MTKKDYCHITLEQRYKIDVLLRADHKQNFIANQLGVSKSTIYRELKRYKTKTGCYNARIAHEYAQVKKERFSLNRKFTPVMERFIREKLSNEQWSPEQIWGYCKQNNIPIVSHERIYQFIYTDKAEGGRLYMHLRVASKIYRKRYGSGRSNRNTIKNRVSIDQRPDCINNKERVGDWEIDTIIGKNGKGAIVTIAERITAFVLIARLNGKNAQELAKTVVRLMAPFKDLVLSITSDNGFEFAMHNYIAEKLYIPVENHTKFQLKTIPLINAYLRSFFNKRAKNNNDKYEYQTKDYSFQIPGWLFRTENISRMKD